MDIAASNGSNLAQSGPGAEPLRGGYAALRFIATFMTSWRETPTDFR